jgi:uncharacterized repeat protein (TIGR03803 family)
MRSKGQSPTLYSVLALTALALIFATNAAAVTEKVIHNFTISPHGAFPSGQLLADAAGNLYGTTSSGGEHGAGAVFRLTRKPDGTWVETLLHSFIEGSTPGGGLAFDTSGNLYGTIPEGGSQGCPYGCGRVFELAPTAGGKWNYTVIYRFKGRNLADYPTGIVFYAGDLYGTTVNSDDTSSTVFELVRSSKGWTKKTIYNFGTADTLANLAIDAVGGLYGLLYHEQYTSIFQLVRRRDGKWREKTLCDKCTLTGVPTFDQAGNIYIDAHDRVIELVRKQGWQRIVIAEFSGRDGSDATGPLTFDESGNLYGTTMYGGDPGSCLPTDIGCGTVFKLKHEKNGEWQHSVLYKFQGERDGAMPLFGVIFDRYGDLYGATYNGGDLACFYADDGCGTVFELAPTSGGDWKYSLIYPFPIGKDGIDPSGLVADASGNLYGATSWGPGAECGTVYELTPSLHAAWKEHILYQFKCRASGGMWPASSLIFDSAGNLYGTTGGGGIFGNACGNAGCGTVFQLSPSSNGAWTERGLYNFTGNADGYSPAAGLVFDAAGNLYGTTEYGGSGQCFNPPSAGCGAVYELSPTSGGSWTETTLHTFMGGPNDGAFPAAALSFDPAGNLYGTTTKGGNGPCSDKDNNLGCGTVFEFSPGSGGVWTENVLYNFPNAYLPNGLAMDSQGNLYTTTLWGGTSQYCNGCGAVYQFSPGSGGHWNATLIYSFGGFASDGQSPLGALAFDKSGNLYGTTFYGGSSSCGPGGSGGCGTVFQLSPSGGGWTESVFYSFSGPYKDGAFPETGVILDAAGNVFGTTSTGGEDSLYNGASLELGGTIFEVSP